MEILKNNKPKKEISDDLYVVAEGGMIRLYCTSRKRKEFYQLIDINEYTKEDGIIIENNENEPGYVLRCPLITDNADKYWVLRDDLTDEMMEELTQYGEIYTLYSKGNGSYLPEEEYIKTRQM